LEESLVSSVVCERGRLRKGKREREKEGEGGRGREREEKRLSGVEAIHYLKALRIEKFE
jgi:hypothetical protein